MITVEQKLEIGRRIVLLQADLGGWSKAATSLGVNQSHLRYNMQERQKWGAVSDSMWAKVAGKLKYSLTESEWQLVETNNTKVMHEYLNRAQNERLFMAISHNAGQGKSAGVTIYRMDYESVFYLECEESWSHKHFMVRLAETLGCNTAMGSNIALLTDEIVAFLRRRSVDSLPLLVIDEANKLKPSSLRLFIPLFNKLQDSVGVVLIGAHDLKKQIQSGVRRDSRGMDELESRFGRTYWPLVGIFENDVREICAANGLETTADQDLIWNQMQPERKAIRGQYEYVASRDLRVLKQAIIHTRLAKLDQLERPKMDNGRRRFVEPNAFEKSMGARVVSPMAGV